MIFRPRDSGGCAMPPPLRSEVKWRHRDIWSSEARTERKASKNLSISTAGSSPARPANTQRLLREETPGTNEYRALLSKKEQRRYEKTATLPHSPEWGGFLRTVFIWFFGVYCALPVRRGAQPRNREIKNPELRSQSGHRINPFLGGSRCKCIAFSTKIA